MALRNDIATSSGGFDLAVIDGGDDEEGDQAGEPGEVDGMEELDHAWPEPG